MISFPLHAFGVNDAYLSIPQLLKARKVRCEKITMLTTYVYIYIDILGNLHDVSAIFLHSYAFTLKITMVTKDLITAMWISLLWIDAIGVYPN